MSSKELTLEDFIFFEEQRDGKLGKGAFSHVLKARHKGTNRIFAIKICDLSMAKVKSQYMECLRREIKLHSMLNHSNVVKMMGHFVQNKKLHIVLEYADNGNLFKYIRKRGYLKQKDAFRIFRQICEALNHLHSKGILHRDIKPENILLDKRNNAKLCDFGWSVMIDKEDPQRETFCGTLEYIAPEMYSGGAYNEKADIWALGILLYEMLHGTSPFKGKELSNLIGNSILKISENIKKGNIKFSRKVSDEAKYIIMSILTQNPKKRPSLEQILRHPLIKKADEKSPTQTQNNFASVQSRNRSRSKRNNSTIKENVKTGKKDYSTRKRSFKEKTSKSFRKRDLSSKYKSLDKSARKYYNSFLQRRKNSKHSAYSSSNDAKFKKTGTKSYTSVLNGYLNKGSRNSRKKSSKRSRRDLSFNGGSYKDNFLYFSKRRSKLQKKSRNNVSTDRSLRGIASKKSRSRKRGVSTQKLTNITKNLRSEIFKRLGLNKKTSNRAGRSPINREKLNYSNRKADSTKNYSYDFTVNNFKFNREASDLYGLRTQPSGEESEGPNLNSSKKASPHYTSFNSKHAYSTRKESDCDCELYGKISEPKSRKLKSLSKKLKNLAQFSAKKSRKLNLRDKSPVSVSNQRGLKSNSSQELKSGSNFYSNRKENYNLKKNFFKTISGQNYLDYERGTKKRNIVTRKSKNMRSFGYGGDEESNNGLFR